MAVRIRLSRFGRIHSPYFRIVAIDGRCHREGKANEIIGSYNPALPDGKALQVEMERVDAWVKEGAQVSTALVNLFKHHGYELPASLIAQPKAAGKPAPKKDGKKWVAPTRRAVRKHAASLKKARLAKAAEEKAARDAAKAAAAPAEGAAQ